jgi:hypothetical protein
MTTNSARIQEEKKRWKIGPSVLVGLMSGVAVGVIMLIVTRTIGG